MMLPTLIVVAVTPVSLAVFGPPPPGPLLAPGSGPLVDVPGPVLVAPGPVVPGPVPPAAADGRPAAGAALLPPCGARAPLLEPWPTWVPPLAALPAATKSLIGRLLPQAVRMRQTTSAISMATGVFRRTCGVLLADRSGKSHCDMPPRTAKIRALSNYVNGPIHFGERDYHLERGRT